MRSGSPFGERVRSRASAFVNHPIVDVIVMILIIMSVGLIIWEANVPASSADGIALERVNQGLTVLLLIELTLRFIAERRKSRFFRRYWIDLIAVLPIFRPMRILRILQLLRVFRLGVLMNRRFSMLSLAFRRGFGEQIVICGIIMVIMLAAAMSLTLIGEREVVNGKDQGPLFHDFWHALRWSALSLVAGEPIGETPTSAGGFVVILTVMLGSLTLFATFTGVVTAIVVNRLRGGLEQLDMDLEELSEHTIVCGFNRACKLIIAELQTDTTLRKRGIVLITENSVRSYFEDAGLDLANIYFMRGDCTHPDVLTRAGAERATIAVVLADNSRDLSDQDRDARTLLSALTLERINPKIFTCAELLNSQNEANLKIAGIDEVIARDKYTGSIIAAGARSLGIVGVLKELLTSQWGNQFYKIAAPDEWVGETVASVRSRLQEKHRAILIAVETPVEGRRSGETVVNPESEHEIQAGQLLVVIADHTLRIGSTVGQGLWVE